MTGFSRRKVTAMNPAPVMTMPPVPPPKGSSNASRGSASWDSFESFMGDDIFMTIESHDGSEFVAIEPPRTTFDKRDSMQNERQISVDPISVRGPSIRQASFRLVSPPSSVSKSSTDINHIPLSQPPPKLKFVSGSLPGSATSSPDSNSSLLKKIWKNGNEGSPRFRSSNISRQRSTMDDTQLTFEQSSMRRSRSVREGRPSTGPVDDFELWLEKPGDRDQKYNTNRFANSEQSNHHFGSGKSHASRKASRKSSGIPLPRRDGGSFKCGKLCLFLPRGKGKPVRSNSTTSTASAVSAGRYSVASQKTDRPTISRTVSLEKFERVSWSSAALLNDYDEGDSANLFFDLPSEMIRCSVSDMQSPVTAAFLFDKDAKPEKEPKGVLKTASNDNTTAKSTPDSSHHVRFSVSSPSSPRFSPRLRKAKDDFDAL